MSWSILNGQLVESDQLVVPATDRGLLLGDGIFETMRAFDGRVFRLDDHLARLRRSAGFFNLSVPYRDEELAAMMAGLIEKNGLTSARVRLTLTRGRHTGAMDLAAASSPTLLITADPIPDNLDTRLASGITAAVATVRFSEHNPIFAHKTLNRLAHLTARSQAMAEAADEALILDERGNAACFSTGNIFAYQRGQLFTPPLSGPVLPGITRTVMLELAFEAGIPLRQDCFSPIMLASADEVLLTNSVQGIVAVTRIGAEAIGSGWPGPVAKRLRGMYAQIVLGE